MATLTLDADASHSNEAVAAFGPSLASRLVGICKSMFSAKSAKGEVFVDGDLSTLNDETLIDLGFDPASVRHSNPLQRFYP